MRTTSMNHFSLKKITKIAAIVSGSLGLSLASVAQAASIDTGNSDVRLSWSNTVKYSAGVRLKDANSNIASTTPAGLKSNTNDGDLNFGKGDLISNRLDLYSEIDFRYKRKYGFRLSGAAWYDDVYNGSNDNSSDPKYSNSRSVGVGKFTDETEKLHGRKAELLDAFVYGQFSIGKKAVNLKAGRFTQLYGESLFFGSNGVAAAQTSLDLIKALSVPNSEFKDVARPIGQVSGQIQLNADLTFGAYYQLEWRKARLPAAGSYFSFADFVDEGGESLILNADAGVALLRGEDIEASDSGQYGFQVKLAHGNAEYGFYGAQFHDKMPQFYARPGVNPVSPTIPGDYVQVFAENIRLLGLSASTLLGSANVGVEMSFRDNMPLVAPGNLVVIPGNDIADGDDNAAYPVGKTMHLNFSVLNILSESAVWDAATFIGELAFNRLLSVTDNKDQLDPSATRDATAIQFSFTPDYFQVLPGLDLQVPISVGYGISGRSAVNGVLFPSEHGGNVSVSLKGDYKRTWRMAVNYNHYTGSSDSVIDPTGAFTYKNFHGDRDNISFSVQRTF